MRPRSGQDAFDDLRAFDTRQLGIETLKLEGESVWIDAEPVQHGSMEIVDAHGVFDDVVRKVVRLTDGDPRLDASSGQEDRETARMMIAAIVRLGQRALRVNGPPKFASPNNEGVLEETSLLEILDERGGRLIGVLALAFDRIGQPAMVIPAHVE